MSDVSKTGVAVAEVLGTARDVILATLRDLEVGDELKAAQIAMALNNRGLLVGGKAHALYTKSLARSVESNQAKQPPLKARAKRHRAAWSRGDDEILVRDGLSLEQKAHLLGRTLYAVERRHADKTNRKETL